ncbi:hypothetical protein SD70_27825 [Gordoniibacillus kamchatkensis]|uniref:DinB-like domain-containing protein n=1 Tax=Gordoniibacillus kamchatkensis TaxID=1590651 RepID=A0ABR5AB70_9BACL|nr:hypothetical protein SD70_27825 [Paenibacillus sp. VKM B-2647]
MLRRNLQITFDQEDWFVPLRTAVEGVTAEQANWRPAGEKANTIAEIVAHLNFYKSRLLQRLRGEEPNYDGLSNDDTFKPDEAGWQAAVAEMNRIHAELEETIGKLDDEALDRPLPKQALGLTLNSILLHDAHHGGQIVYIRKLQGSWPAARSFD